jgi:hypothetical protein
MRVAKSGSQGKGKRRFPGRDGGARKRAKHGSWRDLVPSAVRLELTLEPPIHEFRFEFAGQVLAVRLRQLDAHLSQSGAPFHIKCLGRSKRFRDFPGRARFQLLVSDQHAGMTREALRALGGRLTMD